MELVPRPSSVHRRPGCFPLTPTTALTAGEGAREAAALLRDLLRPATGLPLAPAGVARGGTIALAVDGRAAGELGAEGYLLDVAPERVLLTAAAPTGLLRGVQTLRQLLPAEAWGDRPARGVRWELPCASVRDVPRFRWRGAHLDVARWWMPTSFLFRYVDLLAAHKLNVLHLHLTDDQGWRMEIDRYPLLTEVGAWRSRSMAGALAEERYDDVPHGGHYTRRELRELVAYAERRGVTVVPEIDLPGHTQAAIAAYPELGGDTGAGERVEVSSRWGVHDRILAPGEASLDFCRGVLEEVLDVFPSPFVHIGGDEVPTTRWQSSPAARRTARELGIGVDGLHGWFTGELDAWLHARGRRTVGWDDVLVAGRARPLSEGATVMSWLGTEGALAAAAAGHEVIMTPYDWTYLDYGQAEGPGEPLSMGHVTTLEKVHSYEPVPESLTEDQVLGTQGQVWTEYLPTPERVEYAAFPRLCALAEVAWSSPDGRDHGEFLGRLRPHLARLDRMGVRYRPLDGPS
ncbi:beta-N-acetylhexosaminidase [Streptomyces sp. NPDC004284]|uniref:beta-N-acetylhexosaminidase n=1 Tax=Streptomyces sp. NPDC004284 TaxID=3364695 RepID=UPI0036990920